MPSLRFHKLLAALVHGALAQQDGLIGILGQSGGDVQACSEIKPYSTNLFVDCLLPQDMPEANRRVLAEHIWNVSKDRVTEEYYAVPNDDCNTRLRDLSVLQTEATVAHAKTLTGLDGIQAFSGWKFAYGEGTIPGTPTVYDALAEMQEAGVTQAFVFDQDGMAYDSRFLGGTFRQIRAYLANNTEWNVTIYGLNGFTEQPGYIDLMTTKLRHQVQTEFPDVPASDICVILPSQGTPVASENETCVPRLRNAYAKLQERLPYNLTMVFTNHKPPSSNDSWSEPDYLQKVPEMATEAYSCQHVLATPVLQWPQTDYTVYVFQGVGTKDEPGFKVTFGDSGKAYRHVPSWDLVEESWTGRPPAGEITDDVVDQELPKFTAEIVAGVLAGGVGRYDLTVMRQEAGAALHV